MKHGIAYEQSIHDILKLAINRIKNLVIVIRNVDGSRTLKELIQVFEHHRVNYRIINGNLCLFQDNIIKAIDNQVFTGFDEVWLFQGQPPKNSLQNVPYSTGDAMFNKKDLDKAVYDTFVKENCVLLLADGVELHYLTTNFDLLS